MYWNLNLTLRRDNRKNCILLNCWQKIQNDSFFNLRGGTLVPQCLMFINISEKCIVENRAADEFRAAPSEGAASAFRFDQS